MAIILDGKSLAKKIRQQLKSEVNQFVEKGLRNPSLAVILVGNDPASEVYVKNKRKACEEVGINSLYIHLAEDTPEEELLRIIDKLNKDEDVDGILVQLPLPKHINTQKVITSILPEKDVDGFHPENVGKLSTGMKDVIIPCTPLGIWILLKEYGIQTFKKDVVIVGASNIVGKPMGLLFLRNEEATVSICHKNTKDLRKYTEDADILVVAVGKPNLITADMVKRDVVVIDVGINRLEDGRLVGDTDFENIKEKAFAITPVPGGVGPMTVASLLINTVSIYRQKFGYPKHPLTDI
ncbi:MAG: bifunctional methylenetetrahydrofolate dehydrogenase/methenyltetrahydrofolate cyclohydrolase FolD [Hydrogenothermus sp.]|nr:MAG: bifunctional methylenetetrahydrofolate dehydrogenase/methenyltetrahydrofolate cyclohydrolase FolD [Hydrogenothermus sp.]